MSLSTGVMILIIAGVLNLVWVKIEKRLDAKPTCPNYHPDDGVDEASLKAVPDVLKNFGVTASSAFTIATLLPCDVRSFFDHYEELRLDDVIHLDRACLESPYVENDAFVKIGLMGEEDVLLVKNSDSDDSIYIVGCEDDDPKAPELFATSLANLLAIAWHDYNRMKVIAAHDREQANTATPRGRVFSCFMASLGGIVVFCIDMFPFGLSAWFLISSCFLSDTPMNAGIIAFGVVSTVTFGLIAILSMRSIVQTCRRCSSQNHCCKPSRARKKLACLR